MVDFEYKLIRSRRKTICIQIVDESVIVRAGIKTSLIEIEKFIGLHKKWIERKLIKQRKLALNCKIFEDSGRVLHLGQLANLSDFCVDRNVEKYYIQHRAFLFNRAVELAKKFNITFSEIVFSNAKTIWGTCTVENKVRLNDRLISLPLELIDYVILHEFAHTIHHDHSKLFWVTLKNMLPNCIECRQKLKEYSFVLSIYR